MKVLLTSDWVVDQWQNLGQAEIWAMRRLAYVSDGGQLEGGSEADQQKKDALLGAQTVGSRVGCRIA